MGFSAYTGGGDRGLIQEHELQDIYRLDYGILVKINKYKVIRSWVSESSRNATNKQKIKGMKNLYLIKEDYFNDDGRYLDPEHFLAGQYYLDGEVIEKVSQEDYWYEIKVSPSITGKVSEAYKFEEEIKRIFDLYR